MEYKQRLHLTYFILVLVLQKSSAFLFEISSLNIPDEIPSYSQMVAKTKTLKSSLYENYTQSAGCDSADYDDFPPPKGSIVKRNPDHGYIEMVTQINVWIHPNRIVRVDIEQQSLTVILFQVFFWRDQALKWDKGQDDIPIEELHLNASAIWTPNIFPINFLEGEVLIDTDLVEVDYDGFCTLKRTVQYTIPCMVKIENFPFDEHNCSLTYSQLGNLHYRMKMYPLLQLFAEDTRIGDEDLFNEDRFAHLEWDIKASHVESISGGNELTFSILLKRQSTFYATVLIFPVILLNILSLVVFTLPISTTERENFALTLILTYFVSVMIILEESPPTGNQMPYLGLYVILCTAVVLVTFGMSLILIEIHEHFRVKQVKMARPLSWILEKCFSLDKHYKSYCKQQENLKVNLIPENELGNREKNKWNSTDFYHGSRTEEERQRESFKWKLLCKILNIVFFLLIFAAHIVLACVMFFAL